MAPLGRERAKLQGLKPLQVRSLKYLQRHGIWHTVCTDASCHRISLHGRCPNRTRPSQRVGATPPASPGIRITYHGRTKSAVGGAATLHTPLTEPPTVGSDFQLCGSLRIVFTGKYILDNHSSVVDPLLTKRASFISPYLLVPSNGMLSLKMLKYFFLIPLMSQNKQCQRTRQRCTVLQSIMNESYMIVRVTDTHARGLELEKLKRAPVMPTPARHCSRSRPVIHRQHSILGFGNRETTS